DAFIDTTFLSRQLVSTPEARYAGVIAFGLDGTRGRRRAAYQIQNELSLGDKLQRDALSLSWRDAIAPGWRIAMTPSLEWRRDRTLGRDQEEWRGAFRGRVRRSFADDANGAELGLSGDVLRTSGVGSEFVPDRNAGRAWLAVDHLGLLGDEWRVGYGLASRVFPDSSVRDHFEHGWEGRVRRIFPGGHALTLETTGQRRQTHLTVASTRDNFWREEGIAEADLRAGDRWAVRVRAEGEALQYDVQDSTVFFDYQVIRGRVALRYESAAHWTLAAGPRVELLTNRLNPGEAYRELGGAVEFEWIGAGALWNVAPAAGRRTYDEGSDAGLSGGLHSPFAFYELESFVDQPLPARLRLRALASLRYESHTDPAQNAGSIYTSVQLRWAVY
ncbi:MAG TPA: hypothetical protein VJY35_01160, partial [Candidatus Eisenbacteria bacterium]|nr:hypothetical protein [Candidatus Eisenbacteria bacterium]